MKLSWRNPMGQLATGGHSFSSRAVRFDLRRRESLRLWARNHFKRLGLGFGHQFAIGRSKPFERPQIEDVRDRARGHGSQGVGDTSSRNRSIEILLPFGSSGDKSALREPEQAGRGPIHRALG
jgi:hypothetical protein